MSKIFSLTVTEKGATKVTFQNRLKKLNFDKNFEDIIKNEIDFHGYGTAKIEINSSEMT